MPSSSTSLEPGALDVIGEVLEMRDPLQLLVDDVQPTEPVGLVRLGPQRGVGGPQPPDLALLAPVLEGRLDVLLQLVRQLVAHRVELGPEHGAALFLHRGVELVGGVGEQPHPVLDELRGHRIDRDAGFGERIHHRLRAVDILFEAGRADCRGRGRHPSSPAASC